MDSKVHVKKYHSHQEESQDGDMKNSKDYGAEEHRE